MDSVALDPFAGIEELEKPKSDRPRGRLVARVGKIQVVMMLYLGTRDDLVGHPGLSFVAKMDGHDRAKRRGVRHFYQQTTGGNVARDRDRVAVQLAADDHDERLIEAVMDPLLDRAYAHRRGGPLGLKNVRQVEATTFHNAMIGEYSNEVKNLTLSYMIASAG